jgi:hypothetical protein
VLVRFRRGGAVDATFGEEGVATVALPEGFYADGLARQEDGNLIVAGGLGVTDAFAVLRVLA